jgi:hypothetical protein
MSKFFVILALAFALAAGTVIDVVTIAQSAHAACIGTTCYLGPREPLASLKLDAHRLRDQAKVSFADREETET